MTYRRAQLFQTTTFLLLLLALTGMGWQVRTNSDLARQGDQAHDALCTLKADLRQRILASRDFLDKHPQGIDGITATAILVSITNQEATLLALKPLVCLSDPPQLEGAP